MGIKCVEPKYEVSVQHIDLNDDVVTSSSCYCETFEDAYYVFKTIYSSALLSFMADYVERYACPTDFRYCWLEDKENLFIIELRKITSD